jgi:hypothetical protein
VRSLRTCSTGLLHLRPCSGILSPMADSHHPTKARVANAFRTLQRVTNTPVTHLALNVLETSRNSAHQKLNGTTPLTFDEMDRLASYFGVPVTIFLMDRAEILAWMSSSGWSEQPGRVLPCEPDLRLAA